jgi:hypothetical protein
MRSATVPEIPTCTARLHRTHNAKYKFNCVCPAAEKHASYYNELRRRGQLPPRMVDGTGTRRRVQGLVAIGYTAVQIADAAARSHVRVKLLLTEEHTRQVTAEVAEAIRYTAQALGTRPAPAGWVADRARRHAETRGWWPLDFWDDIDNDPDPEPVPDGVDEIAVMHALAGDMHWQQLGPLERRTVVAEMRQRGISISDIAVRLRGSLGSVNAACDAMRAPRDRRRRRVS